MIALQSLPGIGLQRAQYICKRFDISEADRADVLDDSTLHKIALYIKECEWLVGPDLRRFVSNCVMSHIALQTSRGKRHQRGLPVRGSRGRRNGRTARRLARFVQK